MIDSDVIPYGQPAAASSKRRRALVFGLLACACGLLANVVPAYFILCLLKRPARSSIRPMIEAAMIFLGSAGGLTVGVPLAIICLTAGRRWRIGWLLGLLGLALSLSPWFISGALWDWVVAKQGFVLEP